MKPGTRQALLSALFEAGFVVLGVVLAFAVNEWREAAHDRRRAETALASVVEELRSNREAVAASLAYHGALTERLRELSARGEEPTMALFERGFISPATVFRTAWDSAAATGAVSHLPYDTVLRLSRLYAEQERYERQSQIAGEVLYGELFAVGSFGILDRRAGLSSLIATFGYRESQLLASYDEALAWLDGPAGSETR